MSGLYQLFALVTLAVIAGVGDALPPQKIIGGTEAALGEFPYQVSLRIRGQHFCGGAIIGERHIITAAHCINGIVTPPYTDFRIAIGTISSTGGPTYAVKSAVAHVEYETGNPESPNDIAIVELVDAIKFDENQDKIKLPTADVISGVDSVATGWGVDSLVNPKVFSKLTKITMKTLEYRPCQKLYRSAVLHPQQMCTVGGRGRSVCRGDSGGPIVYNGELVGIVSFGIGCGAGLPDINTNVYQYHDWIKTTIASL